MAGAEIAYIDESYDSAVFAMSALIVPTHAWRETFQRLVAYRQHLKAKYGLFTSRECHATDFVAGRGRIAPLPVPKGLRCFIFSELLGILASLPVAVISGAWPRAGRSLNESHVRAFSRIQERLQKRSSEQDSQILVIADEGKEEELRRIARRSKVWNPVGSQFGTWGDGSRTSCRSRCSRARWRRLRT